MSSIATLPYNNHTPSQESIAWLGLLGRVFIEVGSETLGKCLCHVKATGLIEDHQPTRLAPANWWQSSGRADQRIQMASGGVGVTCGSQFLELVTECGHVLTHGVP